MQDGPVLDLGRQGLRDATLVQSEPEPQAHVLGIPGLGVRGRPAQDRVSTGVDHQLRAQAQIIP